MSAESGVKCETALCAHCALNSPPPPPRLLKIFSACERALASRACSNTTRRVKKLIWPRCMHNAHMQMGAFNKNFFNRAGERAARSKSRKNQPLQPQMQPSLLERERGKRRQRERERDREIIFVAHTAAAIRGWFWLFSTRDAPSLAASQKSSSLLLSLFNCAPHTIFISRSHLPKSARGYAEIQFEACPAHGEKS